MTAIAKNDVIDGWRDDNDDVHQLTHDHSNAASGAAPATTSLVDPRLVVAFGIDAWLFWPSLEASAIVGTGTTSVVAKDLHVVGDDPEVFRTFPT